MKVITSTTKADRIQWKLEEAILELIQQRERYTVSDLQSMISAVVSNAIALGKDLRDAETSECEY